MARFDWPAFLRQYSIPYVTSGPNFSRKSAANIRCPFCGDSDPSEHMGLSPQGWWGCLRNAAHRGKNPAYLVQRLLGCSPEEARRLVFGTEALAPTGDALEASYAALRTALGVVRRESSSLDNLRLPKEFKPLLNGSPFATSFQAYMLERGYRLAQLKWLAEQYKLHYCTAGPFSYRVIIPIYDRYGSLQSWTGRSIKPDVVARYKTLRTTPDPDAPQAPVAKLASNETILGLPVLWAAENPRVLLIVEGPFDALKLSAFGRVMGVYGTALFGLNVYSGQLTELLDLSRRFEQVYLLLDGDAELHRLRLLNQLQVIGCRALRMPPGADDPGAMSGTEVVKLALELTTYV